MADEPPSDADPGPMSDEEWEPFARATGIEPPSESHDDLVDAYYDTGAYLADPTRPGAALGPPFESIDIVLWCAEGNVAGDPPRLDPQAFLRDLHDAGWDIVKVRDE